MRAMGYVRIFTEGQVVEGLSLDAQRERLTNWVKGAGADLAAVYSDAGLSGGRADNRPGLQAALDDVTRAGGVLVVYSLSRLARSVRDTLAIADRLDRGGADLVSLSENIDTTSAAGKMLFRMLAVLAEFERDLISERTKGVMAHKRRLGHRLGSIPIGSRLGEDGRTLVDVPAELAAIEVIRRLDAEGLGIYVIARRLDARGIPTKTGRPRWSHQAVARIVGRKPAAPTADGAG